MANDLTAARLREVLNYCSETGVWTWLKPNKDTRKTITAGTIAGTMHPHGYRHIGVDGKIYASSRLAFLYVTGEWPQHFVDHIDRNRSNDVWSNLRPATVAQNNANRSVKNSSKSGFKGVWWNKQNSKWISFIVANGKRKYLGSFNDPAEAGAAYNAASRELFGEFHFSEAA